MYIRKTGSSYIGFLDYHSHICIENVSLDDRNETMKQIQWNIFYTEVRDRQSDNLRTQYRSFQSFLCTCLWLGPWSMVPLDCWLIVFLIRDCVISASDTVSVWALRGLRLLPDEGLEIRLFYPGFGVRRGYFARGYHLSYITFHFLFQPKVKQRVLQQILIRKSDFFLQTSV